MSVDNWNEVKAHREKEEEQENNFFFHFLGKVSYRAPAKLDKFSIRLLIGRLFHPSRKKNSASPDSLDRFRPTPSPSRCAAPSSSSPFALPFSLHPFESFRIPRGYQCIAPRALSIDRVRLSFFAYLTFRLRSSVPFVRFVLSFVRSFVSSSSRAIERRSGANNSRG